MLPRRRRGSTGSATGRCRTASSPRAPRAALARRLPGLGQPRHRPTASRPQAAPTAAGELRWPLVAPRPARADHVDRADRPGRLRPAPCATRTTSRTRTASCPSSTRPTSSRSTASPASTGWRPACAPTSAISYTRQDPAGWSIGRDARPGAPRRAARTTSPRAPASPAAGRTTSAPSRVDFAWGLTLVNRALFDPDFDFRRNEFALAYDGDRGGAARRLRLSRRGRLEPDPRPAARDQRDLARRPLPGAPELGAARALALRRRDRQQPARRRRRSPTATSAPSSTFRSRAATPHRIMCRPRPRSASACGWRGSARTGERDWPARVCMARGT